MRFCPACGNEYDDHVLCPDDGTVLIRQSDRPTMIGRSLKDTFFIEAQIGQGGMGAVYRGTQKPLGRSVAIKTLLPGFEKDPMLVKRFFREAQTLSQMSHPNIVQVYDAGNTDEGVFFLVMEFLNGHDLEDVVPKQQGLPFDEVVSIMDGICEGVGEAHRRDLIHRDLKPANIFLVELGDGRKRAKVLDFGLARPIEDKGTQLTQSGLVIGTPGYVSPEQLLGTSEADARSDIYAIGAILYFMLTGRHAYDGKTAQSIVARQISEAPAPFDPEPFAHSDALRAIVLKAMAMDPNDRYASTAELFAALEALRSQATGALEAPGVIEPGPPSGTQLLPSQADLPILGAADAGTAGTVAGTVGGTDTSGRGDSDSHAPTRAFESPAGGIEGLAASPGKTANATVPSNTVAAHETGKNTSRRGFIVAAGAAVASGAAIAAGFKFSGGTPPPETTAQPPSPPEKPTLRFGMSAAFSGPAQLLGRGMRVGIETAFKEANDRGGAGGYPLELVALDDGYEPERAEANVHRLIDHENVLGLVGNVGTPGASATLPIVNQKEVPLIGAFTGADILRNDPPDRYVLNYRASYAQETAAMVNYFLEVRQMDPSRIAAFAQADGYGDSGLRGLEHALRRAGHHDPITTVRYPRNTLEVDEAIASIVEKKDDIDAIVMVAAYQPAAQFIHTLRQQGVRPVFANVSFVGSRALADLLTEFGPESGEGVMVTQVVPHPQSNATGVRGYRSQLAQYYPEEPPEFVSLEGFIVGSLVVKAIEHHASRSAAPPTRDGLVDAFEEITDLDLGIGPHLGFGPSDHQASDKVWGTKLDAQGQYEVIDLE